MPPGRASRQSDQDYYYVVLAAAVICSIVVVAIVRGRLGRLLLGLRDSPLALDTEGATTNVTRVLVFCISAFLAGIFGALYAGFVGSVNGATFPSFTSLTIIAVVVLAVGGAPWYALSAAAFFSVVPSYIDVDNIQSYLQIFFGVAVVFVGLRATKPPSVPVGCATSSIVSARPPETGFRRPSPHRLRLHRLRPRRLRGSSPALADARPSNGHGTGGGSDERLDARGGARVGLELVEHHGALRRPRRGRHAEPGGPDRAHHRADRPERRGEDHHVQRRVRPRPHEPGTHRAARPRRHAQRALCRVRAAARVARSSAPSCGTR